MKLHIVCFVLISLSRGVIGTPLGGESHVASDDPDIIRLGRVALSHINHQKNLTRDKAELIEIVDATVKVVSGRLTKLTLKVAENGVVKKCVVNIWERPWLNATELTESNCENFFDKSNATEAETRREKKLVFHLFQNFIKTHSKVYKDENEFNKRLHIFSANLNKIKTLRETEQGTGQYGITKFADMTSVEFKKYLGYKKVGDGSKQLPLADIPEVELPKNFDWRLHNAVTPVKNQKSCGSCWAFSAIGNIEGQWAIKKGQLLSLSEQELVDCDVMDKGCDGGLMTNAFEEIQLMGGLETEKDYPYDAKDEKCHLNKSEIKVKIDGAVNLTQSEEDIAKWIYKHGPVSAALNANAMQFYMGGVSHPFRQLCSPDNLDHGILIVGFGVHKTSILNRILPYWLIKNSWGERWGERGYYRLYRGDGSCGINQSVSSAIII